jgi:PAS domain S-box-containing protein
MEPETPKATKNGEPDEAAGFEALQLVGLEPEDDYDLLAHLAADTFGAPMAGVTLITGDRQYFKSSVGVPVDQTARQESLCRHTVCSQGPLVVPDATADDRFAGSPLVTGGAGVRFYAGAPLRAEDGSVFGALCVMDTHPREPGDDEVVKLEGLARQATALIERSRDQARIERLDRHLASHETVAKVGAWEWNAETDEAEMPAALYDMFGMNPEEGASLETFLERVHELDRDPVESVLREALAAGKPFSYRARIVLPDGQMRTIDTEGEPHTDPAGRVIGLRGATVDVTELVEAEVTNREQAMGLYAAFDTALDPILVVNEERRYVHANRAACALFEYEHEELLGRKLEELIGEGDHDQANAIWDAFLERGGLRGEIELRRADGSQAVAEYSATANFVPDRHLVVLHDVTERRRNERELRESHIRLEETQGLAMVGSWEWNLQSRLSVSSPELIRILGRPEGSDPPSYEEFVAYVHPEDRESYDRVAAKALEDHEPFHQVFRIVNEAGEVRTIESHGRVEMNEAGVPVRMYGAAQDITDRERVEHELRLQANVLEQLPVGTIATNADRLITQWNRGAEELFGITRDEAIGRVFDDLGLIPSGSEELRAEMKRRMGSGLSWEGEIELEGRNGRRFPALVNNSPTRDQRGQIIGYVAVINDLSDQHRYESELQRQGQLLDQVGAGVIGLDPERRVTHWNRGAESLSGWTREEALGRTLPEIGLLNEEDDMVEQAAAALREGRPWEGEVQNWRKDGSSFPTLSTVSPTRGSEGDLTGFVAVAVDISARKRAEEDARRARLETLKRLSRAVETRDPETGGHIERIGEISGMLAERLGMDSEKVELIRTSSPMHDVGKIGIPDEILLKPGKLTAGERAEMQRHAEYGHQMLAGSGSELLDMAASIALTHHERVDGDGYPRGLRGDQIPIEGRIVAVADVFDALTSDRVYRSAMSTEKAIEIMREGRGTQFDPRVLDLLLDDLEPFLGVKGRTPE